MILISFLWSFKQHKRPTNEEKYAYKVFEILDYHIFIINLYQMLKKYKVMNDQDFKTQKKVDDMFYDSFKATNL